MGRECSGGRGGDRGRGYKWSWVGFVSMGGGQRNWVLASGLDAVDCTTTWPMCSRLLLSLMQQPAHGSVSGDVPRGEIRDSLDALEDRLVVAIGDSSFSTLLG